MPGNAFAQDAHTALPARGGTPHSERSLAADKPIAPIPIPDLTGLETAVQARLRSARDDLERLRKTAGLSDEKLAKGFGELGRLYHANHLYEPAIACYRNAAQLASPDFRFAYLRAYAYQQKGDLETAVQAYRQALTLRPDYAPAQVRLAEVYLDLGRPEQALPLFQEVSDAAEVRAAAFGLGRIALTQQAYQDAAHWLEHAQKEQPTASRIHYPLAMAYRGLGDVTKARAHLAQRGDVTPTIADPVVEELAGLISGARTHLYLASKAAQAKQYSRTAEEFRKALALDPISTLARVNLARTLYLLGDQRGAHRQLSEALRRAPTDSLAHYYMGLLLEEWGSDEAAIPHYRAALASDPEHTGTRYQLGNALMRAGAFAEAAHHYRHFIEYLPQHRLARLMEALALSHSDQPLTRQRLEDSLAAFPEEPMFRYALARLLAAGSEPQVRDGAKALALAQSLYQQVDSPQNAETLAMAYAELGDFAEAERTQRGAMDRVPWCGAWPLLPRLEANLARYQAEQPCRTPWPPEDPLLQPPRASFEQLVTEQRVAEQGVGEGVLAFDPP